ncbi:hypothetical protein DTO217A2_6596 [Paecilomyces variotii]|nr:hypothetical protein DTO217A2_6596 [Paecilomyces variotii]
MALEAPQLPTRFPCWCRAVYSWGGETKRDLGFVEGDLIECLNAGDGQWWMGRLRRDRRMMGLFPSNFVTVLGEDFVPVSRPEPPIVSGGSLSRSNGLNTAPKKQKTVFRKPFQAHKEAVPPSSNPSRLATSLASSIPQTPPRDNTPPRTVQPLRTQTTAVKHSSLSKPSSRSKRPARAVSPRPLEPEAPLTAVTRHHGSFSRLPPRAISPRPPQPEEPSMEIVRHHSAMSRLPTRGTSPYPPELEEQSMDIMRQNSSVSRPPTRGISPHPPELGEQSMDIMRHNSYMSRVSTHDVAPQPQEREEPSMAMVRYGSSVSRPHSRAVSPAPFPESYEPTPVRPHDPWSRHSSREISPGSYQEREDSPPPPPPPPHRVAVNSQTRNDVSAPAPLEMNDRYLAVSRTPSPIPPSPEINGHTPSPLRDAMEDVMTSLQDMGLPREGHSPSPPPTFANPWSPDAFDALRDRSPSRVNARPLTSLGLGGDTDPYPEGNNYENSHNFPDRYHDGPPQLSNYVQRMESRLRQLHEQNGESVDSMQDPSEDMGPPPPPRGRYHSIPAPQPQLRARKSGVDLGRNVLNRTLTNKSNTTNSSSGVQSTTTNGTTSTGKTSQSVMSGPSAGGLSATSAGSFARRGKIGSFSERPNTAMDTARPRGFSDLGKAGSRPQTPLTGISYHSSHNTSRQGASSAIPWSSPANSSVAESPGVFGGLSTPKSKKTGFFKKIIESAKTGAASARSSISVGQSGGSPSPTKLRFPEAISSATIHGKDASREMGLGGPGSVDWVQVRRDVNRATSPSSNERVERAERCQMMDHPVIYAVEELYETAEGDEGIDGLPLSEPTNWGAVNLNLVDKSARFVNSLPPMTNPASLAQGYVCRPYKSDVQRLRAIFTWVSEKIAWDEPIEDDVDIDMRRVINSRRGSPQEVAILVREMCAAVGLHAEVIRGFLKTPGELSELDSLERPNHWWNAILVDGEWRIMDCSLASHTNPIRNNFVTTNSQSAESWYFLARPLEICYTHVPLYPEEQHICPPISPDVLLALPAACPPYFKNGLQMPNYDTSLVRIEGLEVMQIRILVPADVECAAEVEAPAFARDADGDFFESGDVVRKRALVQPDWIGGQKRFTIKAVLPGDEGHGVLKIYAGKKGLMHSTRDIPHPLALSLPIIHTGENPPYEFLVRHPTPHAQRHDLYVMQPQCGRLAINNTFVFAVRQHPSLLQFTGSEDNSDGRVSPSLFSRPHSAFGRPSSALSMASSAAGSTTSSASHEFSASTSALSSSKSTQGREKPAKLAIQSPSGKILRLTRKADHMISAANGADSPADGAADGSVWETVIKIGERGVWRGLVLADRSARWCVFCEWECY